MTLKARKQEGYLPHPNRSPIDRHAIPYAELFCARDEDGFPTEFVSLKDRRMHVAVYGMQNALRSSFALRVLEDSVRSKDSILSLTTNQSSQNLGTASGGGRFGEREVLPFGKDVNGFTVGVKDGPMLMTLLEEGYDIVCDVRHILEDDGIDAFFHSVFSRLVHGVARRTTVHLDVFQAEFLRRRHGKDGRALSALARAVEIGDEGNLSFIATATSPNDVPIEIRNGLKTRILCRMNDDLQVEAVQKIIHVPLKSLMRSNIGIANSIIGHGWIDPGDNVHPDRLLLLPIVKAESRAEGGMPFSGQKPSNQDAVVRRMTEARKDLEKTKPTAKKNRKEKTGSNSPRSGLSYPTRRKDVARIAYAIQTGRPLDDKTKHAHEDILPLLLNERILDAAIWLHRAYRTKPSVGVSLTILAYARMVAQGSQASIDTFFDGIIGRQSDVIPEIKTMARELAGSDSSNRSRDRLEIVMTAWRTYAARTTSEPSAVSLSPANDDGNLRQAI